jgi:hypothetical protein
MNTDKYSIAHMAVLTELNISMLGMSGKDDAVSDQANSLLGTTKKAGYYSKCKLHRQDIIDVIRVADTARVYRRSMTRPYGEKDLRMLPSNRILEYDAEMGNFKQKFNDAVFDVQFNWPAIVKKQEMRLASNANGNLFNPNDYPPQSEVQNHYEFITNQIPVPDADHFVLNIEEKLLEKMKRDLERSNRKKMERSHASLLKRLYEPVSKMADICSNDKKVFDSMIQNLTAQTEILTDLNLTGDMDLMQMIDEVKNKLTGFTPGQIRTDKKLKQDLGTDAKQVAAKLDAMMGKLPG